MKGARHHTARPSNSKRSFLCYGLAAGIVLLLLTFYRESSHLAPPNAFEGGKMPSGVTRINPVKPIEDPSEDATPRRKPVDDQFHLNRQGFGKYREGIDRRENETEQDPKVKDPRLDHHEIDLGSDHGKTKLPTENEPKIPGGVSDNFIQAGSKPKPVCDISGSGAAFDICDLAGDVRVSGPDSTVVLVSPNSSPSQWNITPYSRKYLEGMKQVTVKVLTDQQGAPACDVTSNSAALVFEIGGFAGNYWHDFTDILIPVFIGAREFKGNVQFLVVNKLGFWLDKYKHMFQTLSRHEMIDYDHDKLVRCYPRVIVGIGSHKEFSIVPTKNPNGYTMVDFTKFIREAYSLERHRPIRLRDSPGQKPRLMLIHRTNSRKLVNLEELVQTAENVGFETVVVGQVDATYEEFAKMVNTFDVMLGTHGAGLTNSVFLPTGAVLIQIVPFGRIEHIAQTDFGLPAIDMDLKYIEYSSSAEESTLMDMFGKDHPLLKDPVGIHMSGWQKVAEWYMTKQDIRLSMERFRPVLEQAMEHLQ